MNTSNAITAQIHAALWECCPPDVIQYILKTTLVSRVVALLREDAASFTNKDPASGGDVFRLIQTYTSFKAVLHYRLAHAIDIFFSPPFRQLGDLALFAPLISSRGKMLSGAELHFKCQIGKRFVLDHGVGTVFGETAKIGDDCYILGGVTLGACGISNNINGKRHPTIGNRVQVGAFSRIFGTVNIGDDVFIGPHCTITEDISENSRVILRTSLQVTKKIAPIKLLSLVN